ncbi:MAG TPA: signal peptidase I [Acidimicrobiia bacterium]|nr:signal peptidase I [Acidimicrobiia bacterium]
MTDLDPGAVDTTAPPFEPETVEDRPRSEPDGRTKPSDKGRKTRRTIIEWTILIGSALLIAIVIKTFLFQAFYIPSESMKPTLNVGDRVLVNKVSYRLHDVNRGDIVVFETPPRAKDADGAIKDLVKRVVALPGESFSTHDGSVYINGRPLREPYLQKGVETCAPNTGPTCSNGEGDIPATKIPADDVLVLGDNRGASKDSRFFGPIKESSIVGRVFVRIWPINDLGFL